MRSGTYLVKELAILGWRFATIPFQPFRTSKRIRGAPSLAAWPDSVQVSGGKLSMRLPTCSLGVAHYRSASRRSP